ncbi:hypothetical protein D3C87_1654750 [compost metagenome]
MTVAVPLATVLTAVTGKSARWLMAVAKSVPTVSTVSVETTVSATRVPPIYSASTPFSVAA